MKRRKFVQSLALLTGGFLFGDYRVLAEQLTGNTLKGKVGANGKGIMGVVVSDGYSVVVTDKKGRFEITPNERARAVFISTPAGHEFIHTNGITRQYRLLKNINTRKEINFALQPLGKDDNEHQFVIWADPQVKNKADVKKMMEQSVPDVLKFVNATEAGTLLHGITVGDIVWDSPELYPDYDLAVKDMGIPFFQCLGNHDMDLNHGGDENSDVTFHQNYGPTYYSFNRGQLHYVVMDNVRYLGKDKEYDGYVQQNQLDWLQKDLSFVPKDKLIILCLHIPVNTGTKNNEALYALLDDRKVHIMSGHTHRNANDIRENIYEHNHGTVCGAWWTGPICGDGTPCGYSVYKVKDDELSWHYQSTGETADHQFSVYTNDLTDNQKQLMINIWNYDPGWKTTYWIDGVQAGELEQFEGFDPHALKTLAGPNLPNPRGFADPIRTTHLFKAIIPATAGLVKIEATDPFGKRYTVDHKITAV